MGIEERDSKITGDYRSRDENGRREQVQDYTQMYVNRQRKQYTLISRPKIFLG
jgi:hypothetical protein